MDMFASMCDYEAYDMRVKYVNVCVHVEFVASTRLGSWSIDRYGYVCMYVCKRGLRYESKICECVYIR